MPGAKTKLRKGRREAKPALTTGTTSGQVLTLSEAANYLRISQAAILELVNEQSLPGRKIGTEWRFLRSALEDWLRMPLHKSSKEALLAITGNWKDDPHLDELLGEIYQQRGRPMLESDE